MSPKVKKYTDIYVTLTYMGTETHVSFGLFIPEIHFFGQGLKFLLPPKRVKTCPYHRNLFCHSNEPIPSSYLS